jgi:membrane protein implicated in regulation of membrane protease activity
VTPESGGSSVRKHVERFPAPLTLLHVLFVIGLLLALFVLPSPWGLVAVGVGAALDLAETGFFLWWSRRRRATVGVQSLVGRTAVAIGELRPEGQVRVDGEIWRARCERGCDAGSAVVIRAVADLTLEVDPG